MRMNLVQIIVFLVGVVLSTGMAQGCSKTNSTTTGGNLQMKTYYLGRFTITVPVEMKEALGSRSHQVRYADIKEVGWLERSGHEQARESEWKKFLAGLIAAEAIIKTQDFPEVGKWAKGVFYHSENDSKEEGVWKLLIDAGQTAVWLEGDSVLVEKEKKTNIMVKNITNLGKSYRNLNPDTAYPKGDWFYLKHGAINLPYKWQEESDVRFEGHPLKLTIRVEMKMDGAYGIESHGLMEKASAMIDSGYAAMAGVKVKRVRSGKRDVAGMPGEEVVDRLTTKDKTELDFGWEFIGKENSGEYPTTRITMESPDGNLDEKLKIWDAVLDSMQPMFERKKQL